MKMTRLALTVFIHSVAAAIFYCVYSVPSLFSWVQNAEFHRGSGNAPMGMILLILPALVVTLIWDSAIRQNSRIKKIALSLWLIINVVISLTYLVLIDNLFTHRFF